MSTPTSTQVSSGQAFLSALAVLFLFALGLVCMAGGCHL